MSGGGEAPVELPPGYYLTHFERLLDHVERRYAHLLSAAEADVVARWRALDEPARMLYLRLIGRKGPILRASTLCYEEIGPCQPALGSLEAAGLVDLDGALWERFEREAALRTLTAAELRKLARAAGLPLDKGLRKDALVARVAGSEAQPGVPDDALWRVDRFAAARHAEVFGLLRILFFGNIDQGMSTFIVHELEHVRFADYTLADELPLFSTRAEVDDYVEAALARERWEWGRGSGDPEEALAEAKRALEIIGAHGQQPPHRRRVSPAYAYAKVALLAARELERAERLDEACALYRRLVGESPDLDVRVAAADRLGLAEQRGTGDAGFAAACRGIEADDDSAEVGEGQALDALARHRLAYRRSRLKLGPDPRKALRRPRTFELELPAAKGPRGVKARYLGAEGDSLTVEQAALERLAPGLYAENALYHALFGLLCWDTLFAPIAGMFQQPFQGAPLDIDSPHFYAPRASDFKARFEALSAGDGAALAREVRRRHARYEGLASRFIRWRRWDAETLAGVAERLGPPLLVGILDRLARSPKRHGAGLPDLLVWPEGAPIFVEVKGPGDSAHLEQKLWHDHLLSLGADVRVAKVRRIAAD